MRGAVEATKLKVGTCNQGDCKLKLLHCITHSSPAHPAPSTIAANCSDFSECSNLETQLQRNLYWGSWTGFACPSPLPSIPCQDLDLIHVNMQRVWVSSAWLLGSKRQGKLCIVIRTQKPHTFMEPSKLPRWYSEVPYNHLEQSRRMGLGIKYNSHLGSSPDWKQSSDTWPSHLSWKTLIISFDHVNPLHSSSQDLWSLRL